MSPENDVTVAGCSVINVRDAAVVCRARRGVYGVQHDAGKTMEVTTLLLPSRNSRAAWMERGRTPASSGLLLFCERKSNTWLRRCAMERERRWEGPRAQGIAHLSGNRDGQRRKMRLRRAIPAAWRHEAEREERGNEEEGLGIL